MSSYILIDRTVEEKQWWNDLIQTCAVIGEPFEIHCWADEKIEIQLALEYGHKVTSTWQGGTVIRGVITKGFIRFLTKMSKPVDTFVYNKMTPFFTIIFGSQLHSEHYGTEIIISKVAREKQPAVERLLKQMEKHGTVHRNVG